MALLSDADPETGLPRVYSLDEVAAATGLSARSLADGARANKFEHIRLGGKRYMTKGQVEALLQKSTQKSEGIADRISERERDYDRMQARVQRRIAQRGTPNG